jgi:type I restriction enzyme M protein
MSYWPIRHTLLKPGTEKALKTTLMVEIYGETPPQGCADYAFQQHIQKSLNEKNGRSISLWPHGVLFRDSEADMRKKMIEEDLVECVIGLGPNLFYNSPNGSLFVDYHNK